MPATPQFSTLAQYNAWADSRVLDACADLDQAAYYENRAAFFGSIHGTLSHILLVAKLTIDHILAFDERWAPFREGREHKILTLDQILHERLVALAEDQKAENELIEKLMRGYESSDLEQTFVWLGLSGAERRLPMRLAFENFFLHQTHHRGQVHNMLSQTGIDPPALDLYVFLQDQF